MLKRIVVGLVIAVLVISGDRLVDDKKHQEGGVLQQRMTTMWPRQVLVSSDRPVEDKQQEQDEQQDDAHEDHALAHTNCHGLAAELIASDSETLLALLRSEEGRRLAKESALRSLLANATSERAAAMLQNKRGIDICGNSWLDWIPWLPCRVQSPPLRPHFQDEERGGDGEGPLCRLVDD